MQDYFYGLEEISNDIYLPFEVKAPNNYFEIELGDGYEVKISVFRNPNNERQPKTVMTYQRKDYCHPYYYTNQFGNKIAKDYIDCYIFSLDEFDNRFDISGWNSKQIFDCIFAIYQKLIENGKITPRNEILTHHDIKEIKETLKEKRIELDLENDWVKVDEWEIIS